MITSRLNFLNTYKKVPIGFIWSFAGFAVANIIMFVIHVISGRILGPQQYGLASLGIFAIQVLAPIIIGGSDMATIKEMSKSKKKDYNHIISSAFAFLVICALFFFICVYFLNFIVDLKKWYFILILITAVVGLKTFFEGLIRGNKNFRKQAIGKIIEVIIILFFVNIFFFFMNQRSFEYFIASFAIASVITMLFYCKPFLCNIRICNIRIFFLRKIFVSGTLFSIMTFISAMILLADRIIIKEYLGNEMLGIYSAYALSSTAVASFIVVVITNVFFVKAAESQNHKKLVSSVDHFFKIGFIPLVCTFMFTITAVIFLYGSQYVYSIFYVILFSVLGALIVFVSLYNPIITTYSNQVFSYLIVFAIMRVIILIGYFIFLIHSNNVSIGYVLLGLISNYILSFTFMKIIINKFIMKPF